MEYFLKLESEKNYNTCKWKFVRGKVTFPRTINFHGKRNVKRRGECGYIHHRKHAIYQNGKHIKILSNIK